MSKVCFITGSSRGIGLAIAKDLANKGHQVIINSRNPIEQHVLDAFQNAPKTIGQAIGDVSDFETAKQLMEQIKEKYGRIDVLINNAGITRDTLMIRMKEEVFDQVIQTNLKGTFNTCHFASSMMLRQRSGCIINMASIVGITGNVGQVNYAASKAGVIGLTKSLAKELASRSITVNAIAPGFIETDMTDALSERVKEAMLDSIPLKRFGHVEDICKCVDYLMNATYVTGQVLEVNGGLHM